MKKYNIVIINPDQMRWDYMTPNGHPFIGTEHLSRLAAMGTNFRQAFCSCPMCGPSRTSAVTGRYPSEHGVRNYVGRMNPAHPNLFDELKKAGYHRALFGKDHITFSNAIGVHYDEGEDTCIGNMDEHPDYRYSWSAGPLDPASPWNLTERLTTAGLDYITRRSKTDQPFFVTLNYQDPHPYFTAPEPYASLFSPDQFELPENFRREPVAGEPRRLEIWRTHSRSGEATEEDFKKAMAMYCGQIRYVDDQVGRVLDKLEELNLLENTIVLFWSDHGELLGDYGVTHKLPVFYDSLVRIPMVLWDPSGRIAPGTNTDLVEAMDIFASVLDICQVHQPEGSRARSLTGKEYRPRADVFAEGGLLIAPVEQAIPELNLRAPYQPSQFGPGAMLRTGKWKLCAHSFDCWELYDLEEDPHECRNVFNEPVNASVVRELTVRLVQRMMCCGQSPEDLCRPVITGIGSDGIPLWDDECTRIMNCAGILPGDVAEREF
ncbi:MAG: sulfatase-like hydrolase/transferase [Kiritimatiellaceae bacterium]|nr:sulfatase-like hydrolase/transferase [Kiritimatiellaceae bacterium]